MDVTKLSQGERIAAVSGIALFIFMLFAWFGIPSQFEQAVQIAEQFGGQDVDTTANAWQSFDFIDIILFITVVAAVGAALLRVTGSQIEVPASVIVAGLGGLSTLLVLYRVINPPDDASRKIGLFLGLIAAAGVAIGGWLAMQEEGTSFSDTADRLGGGGRDEPPSAPPPPPPPPSGGPPSSGA